jgi:uncharacterized membrane protein
MPKCESRAVTLLVLSMLLAGACASSQGSGSAPQSGAESAPLICPDHTVSLSEARPLVSKYCITCHSPEGAAGPDYDFRANSALTAHRRTIEAKLRLRSMPPRGVPQPNDSERSTLWCWAKS